MNRIDRNLLSITSSLLKLSNEAQYKVRSANEQLSSPQTSLENFQNSTSLTSTGQHQTISTELEISRVYTYR